MNLSQDTLQSWLPTLTDLAQEAGKAIMGLYGTDYKIAYKADQSPATEADLAAEAIIVPGLNALTPNIPVVAEEQVAAGNSPHIEENAPFWLVDPMDGTKEFIAKTGEFTVNIGLVHQQQPILGVIYAPAIGELFTGVAPLRKDENIVLQSRKQPLAIITSRRCKGADLPAGYTAGEHVLCGSSLKFCRIAGGVADIYPRPGRTMEWDTAAGDAILRSKGGYILTANEGGDFTPLTYQKPEFANPAFTAVAGKLTYICD